MPESIQNYQGEEYRGGVNTADGKELDYSYFIEQAQELATMLESVKEKIEQLVTSNILDAAKDECYQTIEEIAQAMADSQTLLEGKSIDPRRRKRLEDYIARAEKMIKESEQYQELQVLKQEQIRLLEGIRHLLLIDKQFDLDLRNRKKFADENV